jgi:hypothetical protein
MILTMDNGASGNFDDNSAVARQEANIQPLLNLSATNDGYIQEQGTLNATKSYLLFR